MAFHRNWIGFFEAIPAYVESARSWRADGIFYGVTGLQLSVFNAAIIEDLTSLSEARLAHIDQTFEAMNLPYSIQVLNDDMTPWYAPMFHDFGYAEIFTDPLMVHTGPFDTATLATPNPAVSVTAVQNAEDAQIYTDMVVQGFDLIGASAIEFLGILLKMRENHHVIGWLNDHPVGAGTVSLCGGEAGVYNVATLHSARRHGVATAVMAALHRHALQHGYTSTSLASSPMGMSMYQRLGYQPDGYQIAYVPTGVESNV